MNRKTVASIKAHLYPSAELVARTKEQTKQMACAPPKRHTAGKLAAAAVCLALLAAVALPAAVSLSNARQGTGPSKYPAPSEPGAYAEGAALAAGLSIIAYAPQESVQPLTANYLNETTATRLVPNAEVLLETYSPLLSSVPGYPLRFEMDSADGTPYEILVDADAGELLGWEPQTGEVTSRGKRCALPEAGTLFWSPLEGQKAISDASIAVSILRGDVLVGQQVIHIRERDALYYAVAGVMEAAKAS